MLPKVNGLYRLTRDAELKYANSGTAILKLGLACSEKYGDKETQLFIDATAFGKPAEIINQYAGAKGTQLYVSGKLQTESWTNEGGEKKSKISMIIEGFDFVAKPKDGQATQQPPQGGQQQGGYNPPAQQTQPPAQVVKGQTSIPEYDIDSEEIPF